MRAAALIGRKKRGKAIRKADLDVVSFLAGFEYFPPAARLASRDSREIPSA